MNLLTITQCPFNKYNDKLIRSYKFFLQRIYYFLLEDNDTEDKKNKKGLNYPFISLPNKFFILSRIYIQHLDRLF